MDIIFDTNMIPEVCMGYDSLCKETGYCLLDECNREDIDGDSI